MNISTWMVWMAMAAFFVIAEIFTAGFFILWFGIGAAAAGLAAMAGAGISVQLLVFIVTSLVLFLLSRRISTKLTHEQPPGIGANRLEGVEGLVIEEIDNFHNRGRVRILGEEWRAESADGSILRSGSPVRVLRVSGTRLIVEPKQKEQS
ncbi:MAG: NfeD family protein [candidate division KSB1 bacterium]|nr:NfeD family protein [candidate division KSB1 bacterium]